MWAMKAAEAQVATAEALKAAVEHIAKLEAQLLYLETSVKTTLDETHDPETARKLRVGLRGPWQ